MSSKGLNKWQAHSWQTRAKMMTTKDEQLAALKSTLFKASDALRVFPLQKNGLPSSETRDSAAFKQALKSYSIAKANVLAFNRTQGE